MRIRTRRHLAPPVAPGGRDPAAPALLGAADHRLLARLRAAATLLHAAKIRPSGWGGEILLASRYDGPRAVESLFFDAAMRIAAFCGLPIDADSWLFCTHATQAEMMRRIHRAVSEALIPEGLPAGLAPLLHQLANGQRLPTAHADELVAAGWTIGQRRGAIFPILAPCGSAHETLEHMAACGFHAPQAGESVDGAGDLGPLAPFVAEAIAWLAAKHR